MKRPGICLGPGKNRRMRLYGLEDKLDFGKYDGTRLLQVIRQDPSYIWWLHQNAQMFGLDEEAESLLDFHLSKGSEA